jgi:rhodanese-related sulfurtransferase
MKRNWNVATILLGLIMISVTCAIAQTKEATKAIDLSPKEFKEKLASTPGAVLVDVRTSQEFSEGIIKGAVNIDYRDPSFAKKISKLDKDKPYFLYCLAGKRSTGAAEQMQAAGFKTIYTLEEGYQGWTAEGLETTKP